MTVRDMPLRFACVDLPDAWRAVFTKVCCVVSTVKFGGVSVMVWGCFSCFGLGLLVLVNGSINSEVYVNILDNSMIPHCGNTSE